MGGAGGSNSFLKVRKNAFYGLFQIFTCGAEILAKSGSFCSDFRYESNGIFVLGVGFFFLQTNFDFLTSLF